MFNRPRMERHELVCSLNPDRGCWLCGTPPAFRPLISELKLKPRANKQGLEDCSMFSADDVISMDTFNWLKSKCGGCPACILSALRQSELFALGSGFNYKGWVHDWKASRQ